MPVFELCGFKAYTAVSKAYTTVSKAYNAASKAYNAVVRAYTTAGISLWCLSGL